MAPAAAAALAVAYLIAIPFGLVAQDDRFGTPEAILAAAILVTGTFLSQGGAYSVRDLTLGPGGITAHFDRIEERQTELEAEVRALQVALTGLVTKFELTHLQKLVSDGPALVRFGNIMLGELTHLDAMQFVRPTDPRGLNALRDDHGSGLEDFDLKRYAEITQEGREYLLLQAQLGARTAASQAGK